MSSDGFEQKVKQRLALASLGIFAAAIGAAVALGETDIAKILMGGALANATTVLNFYFGSSAGSQKKDALLAASVPAPMASPPATAYDRGEPA